MPKNLYYQAMFRRRNLLKEWILASFMEISSIPRLLLEVFVRRNFGERYFSIFIATCATILLAAYPILMYRLYFVFAYYEIFHGIERWTPFPIADFLKDYLTWYMFIGGFVYMCVKRNDEIKRQPSVFDFAKFSLSTGEIHPAFLDFKIRGAKQDIRTVETLIEPGFFLVIGLLLWLLLDQSVGALIAICSIIYSGSYMAAYYVGDHFVMDKIDQMICNEEMVAAFVEGKEASETRGMHFYGRRPANPDHRREVVGSFTEFEEVFDVD
ncbi:hypothetical protein LZD49_18360 [Dyadobacter sp. CY261]|uniref:hypothetical protein n=1 Tax=Dyadobacter sp. CY261 TaxID=2907203 RepID=UPI001F255812|nr:hypothetical protein [Dyadobacter sp. CY261]MCF0072452.1 hypothetical protein [Dyadobacter sp. CY261]